MPEKWTGRVVGDLHVYGVTQKELAAEMGISKTWVNYVLAGTVRAPDNIERKMKDAIHAIAERREAEA